MPNLRGEPISSDPIVDRPTAAGRFTLMSAPLDCISLDEAASRCLRWATGGGGAHNVVTLNAKTLVAMAEDPALKKAVGDAALSVADGVSIAIAARVFGVPLPGRVPGIDLMTKLLEIAGRERLRCYFLGAREEVVEKLCASLGERYPGLEVAGFHDGYFDRVRTGEIVGRIKQTAPHFLFVALGQPEAEIWCHSNGPAAGAAVTMSVGGSFDVLSGSIRRSPVWMRKLGVEWLWRLALEPRKRFRVIFVDNIVFLGMIVREYLRGRRSSRA